MAKPVVPSIVTLVVSKTNNRPMLNEFILRLLSTSTSLMSGGAESSADSRCLQAHDGLLVRA